MMADSAALPPYRRTSPLGGIGAFLLAVLFLSGAIHICAILLVPSFARQDGWSRLAKFAGEGRFAEVPVVGAQAADVAGLDPLFVTGACRLSLEEAPAAITLAARERFWSLALYEPKGTIIFSLNDRTALEGRLDMLVVNPGQNAVLRQQVPAARDQTIVVESRSNDLVALVRLFAPTSAAQAEARQILMAAECVPAALEE
ncbi:MAG TPA: DUF1254 domain-containing protein [Propylenella sp.]|nr:DUF1254 domain-containing protein [Propylenella sp.]